MLTYVVVAAAINTHVEVANDVDETLLLNSVPPLGAVPTLSLGASVAAFLLYVKEILYGRPTTVVTVVYA